MKNLLANALLLLLALNSNAQSAQRINSGEIIASGVKLYDAQKYKEAIDLYKVIPRNDTNYVRGLYELSLTYRADSNYSKAIETCETALAQKNKDYEMEILATLASTYDDKGEQDHALQIYDSALLKYPNAPILKLNKGITLLRAKKVKEAETIFKELVLRDPYYASAHFRLGLCALQKGQLVPAMFSLFTYLMISPSGPYYNNAVYLLDNITKGTDEALKYVDNRTEDDNVFSAAEQIVLSKIALDKNYKTKTSFDDPIIRQLQVMMEKVDYDATEKNFWMQYYTPLFQSIFKEGYFEPLVYHAFSNIQLEPIQRYVKKNDKEIKKALDFLVSYLNPIRSTRELQFTARQQAPRLYHFNEDGVFAGIGTMSNTSKLTGKWTFYHPNGNIKSTGSFINGEKEGEWKYYTLTGKLGGIDNWIAGKQNGEDIIYNNQEVITSKAQYKNDQLQGQKELYYAIGQLFSRTSYKDDKKDGAYTEYFSNGRKKIEAFYKDGEANGAYKTYYKNGLLESEATYVNGKFDGPFKVFYDNGQLKRTGNYKNGQLEGEVKEFYASGKLKNSYTYINNLIEGPAKEYDEEGVVIENSTYKNGKVYGISEYYDNDGKLFSTFQFDNNILKTARYFDKSGKEISKSERQSKIINLTNYNAEGFKISTIVYNDAAEKINNDTYFYTSGKTRETNQYKAGKLNGISTGYYVNGAKEYEINYADDEKDGLSKYYFQNGMIKSLGWYNKGVLYDDWINYNEKGNVIARTTYLEDDINGFKESYAENGKLESEELYKNGWLSAIYQYDSLGNRIYTTEFKNGNGNYKGIHFNGKTSYEGTMVLGQLQGVFKTFYFDGTPIMIKNYDHGMLEGDYVDYHYGNMIASTGKYKSDNRTGVWKFFNTEGKLYKEENYDNGELSGIQTTYFDNGKPERVSTYKNGLRNGTVKRYASNGDLSCIFYYKDDVVTGYTYADKNGALLPVKPLPGGNGKVQAFYSNGNKSLETEYVANLLVGPYRLYHPNGKLYYQTFEDYSNTNGKLTEYYENGNLKKEYSYALDKEDGPYKEFYENGKVKEEGSFYNGNQNGIMKKFDASGKLTETRHYYYGTLLNATK